jgi:hypothetical protein
MATLNGALRSLAAAQRRAIRDRERQAREAAKLYKLQAKQQELQNNFDASQQYENYMNIIQTLHTYSSDIIDWEKVLKLPPPVKPEKVNIHEYHAEKELKRYKPTFFEKIFGLKKRLTKLQNALEVSKQNDSAQNESNLEKYNQDFAMWEYNCTIAEGILSNNPEYYKEVITQYAPFAEIQEIGSQIFIQFYKDYVVVNLSVKNEEIIPNFSLNLTSTGKLSKKTLPVSRRNEIYQDYVCSSALRVAREIFAHIPVKKVYINAEGEMLNPTTGHIETQTVLSAMIPIETMYRINFNTVDPSECMKNFIHNMKFSKTNGFMPVEKVEV